MRLDPTKLPTGPGVSLILFNTWMWSLIGTSIERMSKLLGGRLGRLLYARLNLSARVLLKAVCGDPSLLTPELHARFLEPFPTPTHRVASWMLARELAASGDWYDGLWAKRERIASKPALLLWGMKGPAFGPAALQRWKGAPADRRVVELTGAGHFPQEEAPGRVEEEVVGFLGAL